MEDSAGVAPVLCMISDRVRLGPDWEDALVARVHAAAHEGVHLIHIREPDLDARALVRVVGRCVAAVRGTRSRILVNDRLDVALAAGAHGVHLRAVSFSGFRARSLAGTAFLIGRSVHSCEEATHASADGGLDYLMFGTVFDSRSKLGLRAAGTDALAAAVRSTSLPMLAVGGVTERNSAEVAKTGASGFAAIGLFMDVPADAIGDVVKRATGAFRAGWSCAAEFRSGPRGVQERDEARLG